VAVLAMAVYGLRMYMGGGWCHSEARIDGKTVLITGANTGIGKETALDLARRGGRVILACRSIQKGETAAAEIREELGLKKTDTRVSVLQIDLASLQSVRQFAEQFKKKEKRLDVLINNAGVMSLGFEPRSTTKDGFESTFGVNHLGHFLLTNLLLDVIKASAPSRIITVSSLVHEWAPYKVNFDDLNLEKEYNADHAYRQSKLANILFSHQLAKKLANTGVTTYSLHPGVVRTELTREIPKFPILSQLLYAATWPFFKTPLEGAQTQICCAVEPAFAAHTGRYYSDCVEKEPTVEARNDVSAQKLWDISEKLVKL